MQTIPLHHRGGLSAWLKPRLARALEAGRSRQAREASAGKPKLKATPEQLRALQKKHGKG